MAPLISVVIPTVGRPRLLARAIRSCLVGKFSFRTEVIIVPNGPDASWMELAVQYAGDSRVRFFPIEQCDQNVARNTGLDMACGELVRFLDDDDYLIPEAACAQYELMQDEGLDLTGGGAEIRDKDGVLIDVLSQPDEVFSVAAVLSRNRLQLPFTWVYRRTALINARWPIGLRQSEDIVWLIRFVSSAPRRWRRVLQSVGVWYQHDGLRQSLSRPSGVVHEATACALLEARDTLIRENRWNEYLAHVTAEALWDLVHRAFPFRPRYWSGIGAQALWIDQTSRPSQPVYRYFGLNRLDPRVLLWLLLPKRLALLAWDSMKSAIHGRDYRRTL